MAPVGNERATCVQAGSLCKTPANFADQKAMKFSDKELANSAYKKPALGEGLG
jgi:hypothetical protein